MDVGAGRDRDVLEAIRSQARACASLGSPLYGRLLESLAADHEAGGVVRDLLRGRSDRPVHDAIVLRLLGAVHRLALDGGAPDVAATFPSCGGDASLDPGPPFLAALHAHGDAIESGLGRTVQTNEVGRAAALVGGFVEVARRSGLPLRQREVGASSGLLLNWDRYRYETGTDSWGPSDSPLVLQGLWRRPPRLDAPATVADRRGCDIAPIDPISDDGRLTLLSFVWPDQLHRFERLRAALDVAASHPPVVERADAGDWMERELAVPSPGLATVVHHSIVLQYLPSASFDRLRAALAAAGAQATPDAPLAWLRMEPAGGRADIRLTWWPGGEEQILGTTGYHGQDVVNSK